MSHRTLDFKVHDMVESFATDMWVIGNVRENHICVKPRHSKEYPGGGTVMWGGILLLHFLSQLHLLIALLVVSGITAVYYSFSVYSRTKHGVILFYYHNNTMFCDGVIGYDKTRIKRIAKKMNIDVVFLCSSRLSIPISSHYNRRRY